MMSKRRNPIMKSILHYLVTHRYKNLSFRGGWILTHFFYNDYKEHKGSYWTILKTHLKGWSYSDWCILGINDENRKQYLSTYEYCTLHPLNKEYSSWIDDKLTLKYILHGTAAGKYMPEYYFQIESNGDIISLMDCKAEHQGIYGIIELLKEKKNLAFKLIKASLGVGFYRAEYVESNTYLLNGERYDEKLFIDKIHSLRGYLITEYLKPHEEFRKYCDKSVGCLRFTLGRKLDGSICHINTFMRFGTLRSKFVENYAAGGVLTFIQDGRFSYGNILDFKTNQNIIIKEHPDNGVSIEGEIPHWDKIVEAAHLIADIIPQLCYMGIDFCVTEDESIKIIEINSFSSLDGLQFDKSIFEKPGGVFFRERLTIGEYI